MHAIRCGDCGAPFSIRPDGLFQCDGDQAHELDSRDIDLDGSDTWAVDPAGTLVIVVDPAAATQWAREALAEYLEAEPESYAEWFDLGSFSNAVGALLDAARAGLPLSRLS
ncbi:hypothetical protein ACIBAI_05960 [Streptomyces sp. NPDC051041]|uniref:hypothetical protein n=1 Tax=Streptomyces sp. NPDC051041 TaxID=3365640 RepID=UPI00378B6952